MDKFIYTLIPITIFGVIAYIAWPIFVIFLFCALWVGSFYWGARWVAKMFAKFIKILYPKGNEADLEGYISCSILLLAYPLSLFLIFRWYVLS
jgi:hypothetical protein